MLPQLKLHSVSPESYASLHQMVGKMRPCECYHLATQSFVSYSFDDKFSTLQAIINGKHYLRAVLKNLEPSCRFYFAGPSGMFGRTDEVRQSEATRFRPRLRKVVNNLLHIYGDEPTSLCTCTSALPVYPYMNPGGSGTGQRP